MNTIELLLDAARLCQTVYDSPEIRDLERAYYAPSRWWPDDDQASAVDAARAAFSRAGRGRDYDRAVAGDAVAVHVLTDDCAYVAYVRVPEGESLGLARGVVYAARGEQIAIARCVYVIQHAEAPAVQQYTSDTAQRSGPWARRSRD